MDKAYRSHRNLKVLALGPRQWSLKPPFNETGATMIIEKKKRVSAVRIGTDMSSVDSVPVETFDSAKPDGVIIWCVRCKVRIV
jgi:hypothetical protein